MRVHAPIGVAPSLAILTSLIGPIPPAWADEDVRDCAEACLRQVVCILADEGSAQAAVDHLRASGEAPRSLLDIKRAAASEGVLLEGRYASLEEVAAHPAPVVLALTDPDHFVVALNQGGPGLQLLDGLSAIALPAQDLESRFTGMTLFALPDEVDGPRVYLSEAHHDGGVVELGAKVAHTFAIGNRGSEDLELAVGTGACCGMTAVLDRDRVPPGQSAHLTLGADVRSFGEFSRTVEVDTNAPGRHRLYFGLAARTIPGISVFPQKIGLVCDNLPGGRASVARVHLSGSPETRVVDVEADPPVAACRAVDRELGGAGHRVTTIAVTPSPDLPPGKYSGHVTMSLLREGELSEIRLPLTVTVRPNAIVDPSFIFLGFLRERQQVAPVKATVRCRSAAPFQLLTVESSDPHISVRLVGKASFEVAVDTSSAGLIEGEVELTTDIPLEETISVPFHARIVER